MMKKGNVTILASIFVMALVAAGVGAGTMAYFSETRVAAITLTAGNPNLVLSLDGTSFQSSLSFNPAVWAPGDSYKILVWVRNDGDIGLANLYVTGSGLTQSKADLANWIDITYVAYTDRDPISGGYMWVEPPSELWLLTYININMFNW